MSARTFLAILSAAAAFTARAVAEDLEWCGEARYYPSEYTCFDGATLCPVSFGLPSLPCNGGCYAGEMYQCEDGKLSLLREGDKPFTLTSHSSVSRVDGLVVNACGDYLAIGAGARLCTFCDEESGAACDEYGNETVLLANGEMAVDLPGGQYWYVNPDDGSLMFTNGEDEEEAGIALAGQRVTVYEDGFFSIEGERPYWMACLRRLPGGSVGTTRTWRIYAPSAETLENEDCAPIKLVATSADRKQGAYKYN